MRILFLFLAGLFSTELFAQTPISGIINEYSPVTGINSCANSATLPNTSDFSVGDKILIIQMKGATINQTNTAAFGTITAINNAGNYEFNSIAAINGNEITFDNAMLNAYDISGLVQLITVPQYQNVTVTATLTAQPWNGTSGGVLVFEVAGTLTLQSNISANGIGFRGGAVSTNYYVAGDCSDTDYFFTANLALGAYKGEGVTEVPANMRTGRGALANGGGGGNNLNSGGGGGSNYGGGGVGGNEWTGCSTFANGGEDGVPLIFPGKIFMGGGGGGGHQNNSTATVGGNGGGIILIKAGEVVGNGNSISSNGASVTIDSEIDAAGGGGAGGSVFLDITTYTGAIDISVTGGDGGDVNNGFTGGSTGAQCHGTGGGAGGGLIAFSGVSVPGVPNLILTGGTAGLTLNTQSSCYNTTYGAAPGQDGGTQTGLVFNESTTPANPSAIITNAGSDISICTSNPVTLGGTPVATGGTTPYTYAWLPATGLNNPALANPQATPVSTTTYTLTVTDNNGCIGRDTIIVSVGIININITAPEDSICPSDALALTVSGSTSNLLWSTGATTTSVTVNNPGNYWVSSQSGGCTASDTILIAQNNPPLVALGNDIINCTPTAVQLSAPVLSNTTYLWSTGATTNSVSVNTDGTYWLQITDGCGTSSDTVEISTTTIAVNAGNDSTLCTSSSIMLGETPVATGGTSPYTYAWLPAAGLDNATLANPEAIPTNTTTYTLTVTDDNGCLGHDTIILTIGSGSVAITAPENTICPGDALTLTATANADSYVWSTGETTAAVTINTPGDYWVQSTTADCDANDTITITAGEAPVFSLGNDTIVCSDISHNLKIPNVFNGDYLWSNGETTQSINVEGSGIYWLQVANGCGTGIDSIVVTFQSDSSKHVFFPNCFTPNSDKTNEEFVLLNAPANEYDFTVYNRWGNIIFQSFEPSNNWDGTYKGRDVEEGVYYFVATFKDCKGERLRKAGHITVLR